MLIKQLSTIAPIEMYPPSFCVLYRTRTPSICGIEKPMQMIVNDASGSSQAIRSRLGIFSIWLRTLAASGILFLALQLVSLVHVDRVEAVIKIKRDRQCDGRFGRCQHDDEQRHKLAIQPKRAGIVPQVSTAERDEIRIRPVEHKLDAHQDADRVSLRGHAHDTANEQHRADDKVMGDADRLGQQTGKWKRCHSETVLLLRRARAR